MNDLPTISIVTPSYNQGDFLEETIQSVLEQNYPKLEYIIIDGGSTDGSVDIIKKYSKYLSYWVSEKDGGQTNALNKGFKKASGEIVAWLNSDDCYLPGTLETIGTIFKENSDIELVFGNKLSIDKDGKVFRDERHTRFSFTALIVMGSILSQCASFWRRNLFEKFGYLDETLNFAMDYEFYCRIGAYVRAKHIKKYLAKFRWHEKSKSMTIHDVCLEEHNRIRSKYLEAVCRGYPEILVKYAMHGYRGFCYTIQGDGTYVLRGILRRCLPKSLTPRWL